MFITLMTMILHQITSILLHLLFRHVQALGVCPPPWASSETSKFKSKQHLLLWEKNCPPTGCKSTFSFKASRCKDHARVIMFFKLHVASTIEMIVYIIIYAYTLTYLLIFFLVRIFPFGHTLWTLQQKNIESNALKN